MPSPLWPRQSLYKEAIRLKLRRTSKNILFQNKIAQSVMTLRLGESNLTSFFRGDTNDQSTSGHHGSIAFT